MPIVQSFDPVIGVNPKVLILGSMPGVASLEAYQYYAHPRNAFWPIMAELFAQQWADDYQQRIRQLQQLPLVLWDVLKSCQREGSLDSAIVQQQLQANDIASLLSRYASIKALFFNGATAEKYFRQYVLHGLKDSAAYSLIRLPSTSPAHASKDFQQKLSEWRVIKSFTD